MAIKCGHCHQAHATVEGVRTCAQTTSVIALADDRRWDAEMQRREREEDDKVYTWKMERDDALLAGFRAADPPDFSDLLLIIKDLLGERDVEDRYRRSLEDYISDGRTITRVGLETAVARLRSCPRKGARVTEPGMYRAPGGAIYAVNWNRAKTHLYAKRAQERGGKWELVYAPGIVSTLRDADRMTLEMVEEFGRATGWCCVCGRLLTNPESVKLGIGPICRSRV